MSQSKGNDWHVFYGIFQLDEARKEGEEKKEEAGQQPDVKSEEKAIEMSEDFDAKEQDLEEKG